MGCETSVQGFSHLGFRVVALSSADLRLDSQNFRLLVLVFLGFTFTVGVLGVLELRLLLLEVGEVLAEGAHLVVCFVDEGILVEAAWVSV